MTKSNYNYETILTTKIIELAEINDMKIADVVKDVNNIISESFLYSNENQKRKFFKIKFFNKITVYNLCNLFCTKMYSENSFAFLVVLAEYFNTTTDYLLGLTDEPY